MDEKPNLTLMGAGMLVTISVLLGVNHVIIKVVNDGLQPVFAAGLRSVGAAFCVWLWIRFRGQRLDFRAGTRWAGLLLGLCFSVEFLGLFLALDLTTVTRTSIIFYSMPIWLNLAAHFLLPGEKLTPMRLIGLALAFGGVAWAIADQGGGGTASLRGDLFALLGALGWTALALFARITPVRQVSSEMQMFWQLLVSGPVLLFAALFFGPFIRDLNPWHWAGLGYQTVVVAAGAFLAWFWLLNHYKASNIASFAFLSPVIGVALGWLVLKEPVTWALLAQLVLVAVGIVLINRAPKARVQPPAEAPLPPRPTR
ncbi:DMT family transporter [Maritimibacter sp. UBA3975]|uniref:DMT family transporter n=1 Tax=Maritimibacter sp. UBA3975 TaxID=1946833 RepID=UPI000C08EF50|nr:DMT family transporter [Maritimibacter sp. UBA3975]MAM60189.1 EamA family transporter [Maritimibacter sp.]|tara:strand:+ start:5508 stop:6443 length:936 start_codon:yes stop_codon:yes gene_type:complete